MYCFLPFGFINIIFNVINPCGLYSTFFGADWSTTTRYFTTEVADDVSESVMA